MGMFYKKPPELETTYTVIMAVGLQMTSVTGGYATPGVLEEMAAEAVQLGQQSRAEFLAAGRAAEWKKFYKQLLYAGGGYDPQTFNRMFRPWVEANFAP